MTRSKAHQRRQARHPICRGATGMDSCGARISPCPYPPHPPTMENRPGWGQTGRIGGRSIGFCNAGGRRVRQKPGDQGVCNLVTPRGTKQNPLTVNFKNPRVGCFCPRVSLFLPRVVFCRFAVLPLSISLFSLRKESEREGYTGKCAIHGFFECLKKHPRVWSPIPVFSGDEKTGTFQYWRGFAGVLPPIHASTGRNAYTFPETVRNER